MPEPTSNPPAETPAFRSAKAWHVGFLTRELQFRGQGDSALYVEHYLRHTPDSEQPGPAQTVVKMNVSQRVTEFSTRLNATTGETVAWYIDALAKGGDTSAPLNELQELAIQSAQPPRDARLVVSEYDMDSGRVMYRARWAHFYDRFPVEGDYIEVLINAKLKKVFSYSRVWRTVRPGGPADER